MSDVDVSVLVTHLEDPRGLRAIESLAGGEREPEEVVLADGGSGEQLLAEYRELGEELAFPLRIVDAPGSVAASREQAWGECVGEVIAFLDTDERAPADWLASLIEPVVAGEADFAAGPTRPIAVEDRWDRYHEQLDAWFYRNFVAEDVVYAPMGNTAWSREVFETLGAEDGHVFDTTLDRGGEDFDVNVRALKRGFEGVFVPEAVLEHDYATLKGYRTVLSKKYHYAKAEARVRERHEAFLAERGPVEPEESKPFHPIELFEPFVRRWALLRARFESG